MQQHHHRPNADHHPAWDIRRCFADARQVSAGTLGELAVWRVAGQVGDSTRWYLIVPNYFETMTYEHSLHTSAYSIHTVGDAFLTHFSGRQFRRNMNRPQQLLSYLDKNPAHI